MKRIMVLVAAICMATGLFSQEAQLEWAVGLGGNDSEEGSSVEVDAQGNVYTTGYFSGTADFDPDPLKSFNLISNGSWDIFISKLDSAGNFVWAKNMGGSDYDNGSDIAIDPDGNVYTTGFFNGTVDFDPDPQCIFPLTSNGGYDVFISKLDASGNFVWAKSLGGEKTDYAYSLALDNKGNILLSGCFKDTVDFDPGQGMCFLSAESGSDIFISKLDANGNFVWATRMGGGTIDKAFSLALDADGNVYTTGQFKGTTDFDPGAATAFLSSNGDKDIFISKLNTDGNFVWAKNVGGSTTDEGYSVAIDATGNVFVTGKFSGTADFDPGKNDYLLSSNGSFDLFLLKLDPQGNFICAKSIGGTSIDYACSLAFDENHNVYQTGVFAGTVDFDPGAGVYDLTSNGSWDIFITKLDNEGNFIWAKKIGGTHYDNGYALQVDKKGNLYATGYFMGTSNFSPEEENSVLTSTGDWDVFVMKLSQPELVKSYFSTSDTTIFIDKTPNFTNL